jgi:ABC-type transport system involved in cytochrome bd biosynthesis fused ATPase/permease subunit
MAPAIEPFLVGRTVIVVAHEPVLLPHFHSVVFLDGARPTVAAS